MNAPPVPSIEPSDRLSRAAVWLLVLIATITFASVVGHPFSTFDDDSNFSQNPLMNPPTWDNTLQFWKEVSTGFMALWVPVTFTIWSVLAHLTYVQSADENNYHLDPRVFHAANLAVHILAVIAVFVLLHRLVKRPWPAFWGAVLFAVHPLQAEPVNWTSGLKDLLYGMLSIVALGQYLAAVQHGPAGKREWIAHYLAGTLAFMLAMLSKPTAVVTPIMALALHLCFIGRLTRRAAGLLIPWFLLAVPILIVARRVQEVDGIDTAPLWFRPILAGDAFAFYLWKLLAPWPLLIDYGLTFARIRQQWWGYLGWLVPASLVVLAWWGRRKRPLLLLALLWFIIPLLPNSGLSTFQFSYYSVVADHYVYFAMLGPALVVAWIACRFQSSQASAIMAAIALALMIRSVAQSGVWVDDRTLYLHVIDHNPRSFLAWGNLGLVYDNESAALLLKVSLLLEQGRTAEAAAVRDQAVAAVKIAWNDQLEAQRHKPDRLTPTMNLISIASRLGEDDLVFSLGRRLYALCQQIHPGFRREGYNRLEMLGLHAEELNRWAEATEFYGYAMQNPKPDADLNQHYLNAKAQLRKATTRPAATTRVTPSAPRFTAPEAFLLQK